MKYRIEFSARARDNLQMLRKRDQQIVVDSIEGHLEHEPNKPTRNRKRLQDNLLAPWELRIGGFRVFYDIDVDDTAVVIVAVGQKFHNKLSIGGEEIEL